MIQSYFYFWGYDIADILCSNLSSAIILICWNAVTLFGLISCGVFILKRTRFSRNIKSELKYFSWPCVVLVMIFSLQFVVLW